MAQTMTALEQSTVRFGRTSIPYAVERGRRHKTVAIAVDPECGVRVRAPQGTAIARLDDIVRSKAKWIIDRRRQQEDLPPQPTSREFVNGEAFLYAGKQYRLKFVPRVKIQNDLVRLVAGRLCVSASRQTREVLIDWYRDRAKERLGMRVQVWAERRERLRVVGRAMVW